MHDEMNRDDVMVNVSVESWNEVELVVVVEDNQGLKLHL